MRSRRWNAGDESMRALERAAMGGDNAAAVRLYYEWKRSGSLPQRVEVVVDSPFGAIGILPTEDHIWLWSGRAPQRNAVFLPSSGESSSGRHYKLRTSIPFSTINGEPFSVLAAYTLNEETGKWGPNAHYSGYNVNVEREGAGERPSTHRLRGARRAAAQIAMSNWLAIEDRAKTTFGRWADDFVPEWAAANEKLLREGETGELATQMEAKRANYEFHLDWVTRIQEELAEAVRKTLMAKSSI